MLGRHGFEAFLLIRTSHCFHYSHLPPRGTCWDLCYCYIPIHVKKSGLMEDSFLLSFSEKECLSPPFPSSFEDAEAKTG